MAKSFGGSASRLEVYALFVAAVVLIGGGVAGAVVVTSSDSKPAEVAQVSVDTTVVDTTAVDTAVAPAPDGTTSPTTTAQRYYNPEPQAPVTSYPNQPVQTVAPQPIQDYSAYCTMPNLVGIEDSTSFLGAPLVEMAMTGAGCSLKATANWCFDPSLEAKSLARYEGFAIVLSQTPSAGTLIHRSLGSASFRIAYYSRWAPGGAEPSKGSTPC